MKDNSLDAVTRGGWECAGLVAFQGKQPQIPWLSRSRHTWRLPLDAFRGGTKPLHLLCFWSALVQHMSQMPSTAQDHLLPANLVLGSFSLPTT